MEWSASARQAPTESSYDTVPAKVQRKLPTFAAISRHFGGNSCNFGRFSDAMIASEEEVPQPAPHLQFWVGVYRERCLHFTPKKPLLLCPSPSTSPPFCLLHSAETRRIDENVDVGFVPRKGRWAA